MTFPGVRLRILADIQVKCVVPVGDLLAVGQISRIKLTRNSQSHPRWQGILKSILLRVLVGEVPTCTLDRQLKVVIFVDFHNSFFDNVNTTSKNIPEINDNGELNHNKNRIINKHFYSFSITMFKFLLKTFLVLLKVFGIYLLWICLHYFSAHLYIKFCVPDTILGFLMSPFMIATPHCQGLRWIVYNAAGIINNMWMLIGAWVYSMIWVFNRDNNMEPASL
jgi:hypothetical protein